MAKKKNKTSSKYSSHRNIKPEELREILNSAKINKQ